MQGYSMVVGHFSSSITWLLIALRTTDTKVYLLQFGELPMPLDSKARTVHQHGTSSGGHHLSRRLLAAVRKFSFIHYEMFVHPIQSPFFIEVKVIFQKSQINMWLPGIRTPLKPPFASRKMSELCNMAHKMLMIRSLPVSPPCPSPYKDAAMLRLLFPSLSCPPSPITECQVDLLLLYHTPLRFFLQDPSGHLFLYRDFPNIRIQPRSLPFVIS